MPVHTELMWVSKMKTASRDLNGIRLAHPILNLSKQKYIYWELHWLIKNYLSKHNLALKIFEVGEKYRLGYAIFMWHRTGGGFNLHILQNSLAISCQVDYP